MTETHELDTADVLVVDDMPVIVRELTDSLNSHGITAIPASTGEEAVDLARSHNVKVAVVDLAMPGMDGIQTAKALQSSGNISVIFLSAHDNQTYRDRAAREHLTVERWIEKTVSDPSFETTIKAVSGVLGRRLIGAFIQEFNRRLSRVTATGTLTPEQVKEVQTELDLPSILVPAGITVVRTSPDTTEAVDDDVLGYDELLSLLAQYRDDLVSNYPDTAHREMVWGRIRTLIERDLWKAVSCITGSTFVSQLVVLLEQAVRRIPAPLLEPKHIDSLGLTLERMSSSRVDASDVAMCKKTWRATGVDTLPSFEKIMREWETLYAVEGPDDPTDEHLIGNDNSITQDS